MPQTQFHAWRALCPTMFSMLVLPLMNTPARADGSEAVAAKALTPPSLVISRGDTRYVMSSQPNVWIRTLDPASPAGSAFRSRLPGAPGVPTGPVYREMKTGACVADRANVSLTVTASAPRKPSRKTAGKGGRR
jgi:hypothetical protein